MKRIVVIGGGTGTFTVLSGLRKFKDVELTAIVTMADDGGSTGMLRDEFGVLPPGDLRQCLVALSEGGEVLRQLFNHRFDRGSLRGHNFGNIFISTLEQVTGNLDSALDVVGEVLKIRGKAIPVTLNKIRLMAELKNGKVLTGERELTDYQLLSRFGIKRIFLKPVAKLNPKAGQAIREADAIIIGPGNLYSSLLPNFLVKGMKEAVVRSEAKKIYIANLMNKHGQTDEFTVADYVLTIEEYIKKGVIDVVIYNTKRPRKALLQRYIDEGDPVSTKHAMRTTKCIMFGTDLLADKIHKVKKGDLLRRTLIRHDPSKIANAIMKCL